MRTAILQHTLPDGTSHIDWLVEVDPAPADRVPTFRLDRRPDEPGGAEFRAERLPDHRRMYLSYEGPVSGGRGEVERVAEGSVLSVVGWPDRLELTCQFAGRVHRWEGRPSSDGWWRFRTVPAAD